jgi:hypothetical protein
MVLRDKNGEGFRGWRAELNARVGIHAPAPEQALVRLSGFSAEEGKDVNDLRLLDGLDKFPTRVRPTHIFMNPRSARQLRDSRYARNYISPELTPF